MSTAIGHVKPQCVQSTDQKDDDLRKAEKRNCKAPNINAQLKRNGNSSYAGLRQAQMLALNISFWQCQTSLI